MKKILQRILDSVVAVAMIGLSLVLQAFFFLFLGFGIIGISEVAGYPINSDIILGVIIGILFIIFNSLACYVYFKQNRANVGIGKASSSFFYIPRAIDTIVCGSQRVSRSEGASELNACGAGNT